MSKASAEQFQQLIRKAIVDAQFREQLIASPRETAQKEAIVLDDEDVEDVKRLAEDLRRFGGKHATDVDSWTIGILQIRKVPR